MAGLLSSPLLQGISRIAPDAGKNVASQVQQTIESQKPTTVGTSGFQEYVNNAYGGQTPDHLKELEARIASGSGINDYGVAEAVKQDAFLNRYVAPPSVAPVGFTTGVNGPNVPSTGLKEIDDKIGAAAWRGVPYDLAYAGAQPGLELAQLSMDEGGAREPKGGPGLFGGILSLAVPAAGALFNMGAAARNNNLAGAFGSLLGLGAGDILAGNNVSANPDTIGPQATYDGGFKLVNGQPQFYGGSNALPTAAGQTQAPGGDVIQPGGQVPSGTIAGAPTTANATMPQWVIDGLNSPYPAVAALAAQIAQTYAGTSTGAAQAPYDATGTTGTNAGAGGTGTGTGIGDGTGTGTQTQNPLDTGQLQAPQDYDIASSGLIGNKWLYQPKPVGPIAQSWNYLGGFRNPAGMM